MPNLSFNPYQKYSDMLSSGVEVIEVLAFMEEDGVDPSGLFGSGPEPMKAPPPSLLGSEIEDYPPPMSSTSQVSLVENSGKKKKKRTRPKREKEGKGRNLFNLLTKGGAKVKRGMLRIPMPGSNGNEPGMKMVTEEELLQDEEATDMLLAHLYADPFQKKDEKTLSLTQFYLGRESANVPEKKQAPPVPPRFPRQDDLKRAISVKIIKDMFQNADLYGDSDDEDEEAYATEFSNVMGFRSPALPAPKGSFPNLEIENPRIPSIIKSPNGGLPPFSSPKSPAPAPPKRVSKGKSRKPDLPALPPLPANVTLFQDINDSDDEDDHLEAEKNQGNDLLDRLERLERENEEARQRQYQLELENQRLRMQTESSSRHQVSQISDLSSPVRLGSQGSYGTARMQSHSTIGTGAYVASGPYPKQLDEIWLEKWSFQYETPYYVNTVTGQSQWERPAHLQY
eukprot:CAMPEP_0184068866 /NCGR_PEP_ID=MMETSP0957-20130417/37687_1 /TAXON_ID=627963 /ORGANISM="Aplanochytrium sp, Strain PBS07" /LENGTH=452 /DNA_ID=CAMNT_0026368017 /DNA_START=54 /DNA_END=1412 /DNA_ORIENTATION=-